jgi:sec-independent protein translocase protein TatA
MPFNIGPGELIIVLIIALVVLGPGKLPEVGSALGKSIREFRKAAADVQDAARIDPLPPATTPAPGVAPVSSAPAPATAAAPVESPGAKPAPAGPGPEAPAS